jgi:Tfp pilus assembly protein FimV
MSNMEILWVVSVVAAMAAVVGIVLLRRKNKQETTSNGNGNGNGKTPPTGQEDSLFSTFDDQASEANSHLDPIAEADVYLAYGNRQQAVSVLRKAAQENPGRDDILEKIREIRETLKDASGP